MAWLPFVFIATGIFAGFIFMKLPPFFFRLAESAGNIALIILMIAIGVNIGADDTVINHIGSIGLHCAVITFFALICSVIAVFILEKTLLPLDETAKKILSFHINKNINTKNNPDKKSSFFIWIIPICMIAGIVAGIILPQNLIPEKWTDTAFTVSLMILYVSVGIGLSQNRHVFAYVKMLGWKIILISFAIILGSLTGGLIAGLILDIQLSISVLSACGMSYYSLTGAFMTQFYGINAGTYGFLVNVMREFITILLLPILVRISKGTPIACGGAADMDTVLMPVTKFVGTELGIVVLITGTVLTFAVPALLQLLSNLFFYI